MLSDQLHNAHPAARLTEHGAERNGGPAAAQVHNAIKQHCSPEPLLRLRSFTRNTWRVAAGQEESLAKRKLPVSERLLMTEADVHGLLLDGGRSAITAIEVLLHDRQQYIRLPPFKFFR